MSFIIKTEERKILNQKSHSRGQESKNTRVQGFEGSRVQGNHLIQNPQSLAQTDHAVKMPFVRLSHKSRSNVFLKSAPGRAAIRNVEPHHLFVEVSTDLLRRGQSVRFRAPGWSMHPSIKDGETITVEPVAPCDVKRGDIILYRSQQGVIAHRVVKIQSAVKSQQSATSHKWSKYRTQDSEVSSQGSSFTPHPSLLYSPLCEISNPQCDAQSSSLSPHHLFSLRGDASNSCDEPVEPQQVLGIVVSVERQGHIIDLYSRKAKILHAVHSYVSNLKNFAKSHFLKKFPLEQAKAS